MNNAKITYLEEANELLSNLEIALLALETNSNDKSYIEEVFRVMHTLKGNSSMFGLTVITDFVHNLETIYDKIRTGTLLLTKDLLDCTLLALDHLKIIIHDSDLSNEINRHNHDQLIKQITQFIEDTSGSASLMIQGNSENNTKKTYHIYFEPSSNIFDNGSNPLFLLAELASFGNSKAIPHFKKTESLNQYNSTECITYWDIYLETEKDNQEILDVFVFVEDNSNILITEIGYSGLIDNSQFVDIVSSNKYQDIKMDSLEVIELAQLFSVKKNDLEKNDLNENNKSDYNLNHLNVKEKNISSVRVSSDKLVELMNLISELVTTQAGLTLFTSNNRVPELEPISENVEKLSRRLRDIAFGMTLIPVNNMFGRFQRMVRDISGSLGKEIDFLTEGGETELDKTIIETLTDPLMHIIRNSLDHGIERAEERIKKGKSSKGQVTLKAYYSGVFVYIQISDDGKGIDTKAVRNKAISKGIIKEEDILSENEIFDLIFYPGFSTAEQITDVSGRGVGMDVVKRNITDLKGTILVQSALNAGTTLTIKLPLTLSIIDGLLVSINKVSYIIPLSVITKCYEVDNEDLVNNFNRLLLLDEEQIPFINLRKEFGYETDISLKSQMIVVNNGERKVGICIDLIVGEYQAVIKPIGKYYRKQDFVSGATILGDGTIALVLDTNKIIEQFTQNFQLENKI
jgi:two-component system, chemotaxis family, sensor kinase CheA